MVAVIAHTEPRTEQKEVSWRNGVVVLMALLASLSGYALGASAGLEIRSEESCRCPIWTRNRAMSLGSQVPHPIKGLPGRSSVEKLMYVEHVIFNPRRTCVSLAARSCSALFSVEFTHSRAI